MPLDACLHGWFTVALAANQFVLVLIAVSASQGRDYWVCTTSYVRGISCIQELRRTGGMVRSDGSDRNMVGKWVGRMLGKVTLAALLVM